MVITNSSLHIEQFHEHFKQFNVFNRSDIMYFYKNIDSDVPMSTVDWRIYELSQQGYIHRVARGKYQLGAEKVYKPNLDQSIINLSSAIHDQFPFINYCLWNSGIINEFTQHLSSENYHFIEVEKEAAEAVFHFLQGKSKTNSIVFINPSEELMNQYVRAVRNAGIVKDLVTESPLQELEKVPTITLEKLLVDLFTDKAIFQSYQGRELVHIFERAYQAYSINQSKLLRYASRRGQREKIMEFQKQIFGKKVY